MTGILTAALMGMQLYSKRSIQAVVKLAADSVGTQDDGIRQEAGQKDRPNAPGAIVNQQSKTLTKRVWVQDTRTNWPANTRDDGKSITHPGYWKEYYDKDKNVTETWGAVRAAPEKCAASIETCKGLVFPELQQCQERANHCTERAAVASFSTTVTDE